MRSKEFKRTPFTDWMDNIERVCVECGRKFDLMDEEQSSEWHYGHDCEAQHGTEKQRRLMKRKV